MNLYFPDIPDLNYKSRSQRIRVISELWMKNEMYCPVCGCDSLIKLPNNMRLADFICGRCSEIYELKSKGTAIGKSILDGSYYTALERITSRTNPNLFILRYDNNAVENLILVPKYFFTPNILRMRNALSFSARRAGYIGSVIMYGDIPEQGKVKVIESHRELKRDIVMKNYRESVKLRVENINLRGWLMDILNLVNRINHDTFSLNDVYAFADELALMHSGNHNVRAKIRQQLQFLRNKGFIDFLGRGLYKKIYQYQV